MRCLMRLTPKEINLEVVDQEDEVPLRGVLLQPRDPADDRLPDTSDRYSRQTVGHGEDVYHPDSTPERTTTGAPRAVVFDEVGVGVAVSADVAVVVGDGVGVGVGIAVGM